MADEETKPDIITLLEEIGFEGVTDEARESRKHAIDALIGTDWGAAEAIEFADHLLFPDVLTRRTASGKWETKKVKLRVPRENDLRQARVDARALAASSKIDEERDRDLFTNLENLCVLSVCIRNSTSPYEAWEPDPLVLEAAWDKVCLQNMWEKIDRLNDVLNPSPNQLSTHEIVALIAAIAKARHLGPLAVYGSGAQTSLVVSMADLLLNLVEGKFSLESSGLSTPES